MATQTLKDRLVFTTETGESALPPECALLVLTSTLATPITFVVHHLLQELLKSPTNGVVFLSFLNGGQQVASNMRKLGLDVVQAQQQHRFVYIDGFSQLFLPISNSQSQNASKIMTLTARSPWLTQLAQAIVQAFGEVKVEKPCLFIEGLDLLLAAGEDSISANEMLTLLSTLAERTSRIFMSLFADNALLDSSESNSLSKNQSILLTSLVHRAYSVISLRPLQTGTAKDVTGVIRLTRGGAWYDFERGSRDSGESEEWEMLYRLEDGRPKLFKHA